MRTSKTFKPCGVDRLEARDVPSSFSPGFLVRGNPAPPAHIYPVGVYTPYFVIRGNPAPPAHIYPVGVYTPYSAH